MVAAIGGAHVQPLDGHGGVSDARSTAGTIGGQTFTAQSSATRAGGRPADGTPANNGDMQAFKQSEGAAPRHTGQATTAGAPENHASPITQTHTTQVFTTGNFVDFGGPTSPAASAAPTNDTRATSDAQTATQTTPRESRKGSSLRQKLHTAFKFAGAAVVIGGAATAVAAGAAALAAPVLLAGLGVAIGGVIVLTVNHFTRPGQA
ncbi:hypothetical protein [Bordetella sp. LUAb4]|uniref:hypothetical protein n=1 Tax=Bordetella sp. LUAb4 TaxID=2843195 RepID=UPI001E307370|nr:hypothetical protein [Bordetella sp. LUAb4]